MIKSEELRIGNYVMHSNDYMNNMYPKGYWKVTSIGSRSFRSKGHSGKYFDPIPLTEEWLIKFGAKELKAKRGVLKEFVLKTVRLEMSNSHNIYYKNSKIIISSVHHLQNLFFALTGQELEIK